MPADANQHGDIFGGWVMSQVDIAGGVLAAQRARGRVATVAVNSFVFKEPVLIGDVVSLYSEIVRSDEPRSPSTSTCTPNAIPTDVICVKVTEASLTYVAVGRRPAAAGDPARIAPRRTVAQIQHFGPRWVCREGERVRCPHRGV